MRRSFLLFLSIVVSIVFISAGATMESRSEPRVGGHNQIGDLNDKAIVEAASHGLKLLNAKSNDMYSLSLVKVKSGTKQVVRGVIYRLEIECGVSKCRNEGSDVDLKSCPLVDEDSTRTYQISVLWTAWETPKYKLLYFKRMDS